MARIKLLRRRLSWSQKRMAEHLHCSQATVARMELGQPESGPVSILLDQLDAVTPAEAQAPEGASIATALGAAA